MTYKSHNRPVVRLSALLLLTLTSCASLTSSPAPTNVAKEFCLIAQPIMWSPKDTDDTIRQIKSHNAVGKELCGWGKATK